MTTQLLNEMYLAEKITPGSVDTTCAILEHQLDDKDCTLVFNHPHHCDGTPAGTVTAGRLGFFHTTHFEGGRAALFFCVDDTTLTIPVGQGNVRTSQSGVDHAATVIVQSGVVVISWVESSKRHHLTIVPH